MSYANNVSRGLLAVTLTGTLLLSLSATPASAVPARIANRMVPSWWQYAKTACYGSADCEDDECCARPMLSSRAYCMPLKARTDACDATPYLLDDSQKVYFGDCPCESDLTCGSIETVSQCIDYHSLELENRRFTQQRGFGHSSREYH